MNRWALGLVALALGCSSAPKEIPYIDGNTQQVMRVARAADLPDSQRYVTVDGKKIPVAKVVMFHQGTRMEIHQYGPSGELLNSTMGFAPAPP